MNSGRTEWRVGGALAQPIDWSTLTCRCACGLSLQGEAKAKRQ
jgi:hypothetical protein